MKREFPATYVLQADNSVKNVKMTISNPKLHNITAYTKFGKSIDIYSSDHLEMKYWPMYDSLTHARIDAWTSNMKS